MSGALEPWGPLRVIGRLGGGNRNEVLEVRRGTQRLVSRRSRRSAASLTWEVRLLEHLAQCGVRVPAIVPALDGRAHVEGVLVMSWLDGRSLRAGDWPAVAATLRRVHDVTRGWPQRPAAASTRQLLTVERRVRGPRNGVDPSWCGTALPPRRPGRSQRPPLRWGFAEGLLHRG